MLLEVNNKTLRKVVRRKISEHFSAVQLALQCYFSRSDRVPLLLGWYELEKFDQPFVI